MRNASGDPTWSYVNFVRLTSKQLSDKDASCDQAVSTYLNHAGKGAMVVGRRLLWMNVGSDMLARVNGRRIAVTLNERLVAKCLLSEAVATLI